MIKGLIFLVVLVFGSILYAAYRGKSNLDSLYAKCLQDGHKDYECYSMLRSQTR